MARVAATTAVLAWIKAHPTLMRPGNLDRGAFDTQIRSPASGSYLWLTRIDGADGLVAEDAIDQARMAGVVFSATRTAAEVAAVAYANALAAVSGAHTAMGDAVCLVVADIAGPQLVDDQAGAGGELVAFQVDATFYLR